jgi:hypothetical protein
VAKERYIAYIFIYQVYHFTGWLKSYKICSNKKANFIKRRKRWQEKKEAADRQRVLPGPSGLPAGCSQSRLHNWSGGK